jgi:hypothetical protein
MQMNVLSLSGVAAVSVALLCSPASASVVAVIDLGSIGLRSHRINAAAGGSGTICILSSRPIQSTNYADSSMRLKNGTPKTNAGYGAITGDLLATAPVSMLARRPKKSPEATSTRPRPKGR